MGGEQQADKLLMYCEIAQYCLGRAMLDWPVVRRWVAVVRCQRER